MGAVLALVAVIGFEVQHKLVVGSLALFVKENVMLIQMFVVKFVIVLVYSCSLQLHIIVNSFECCGVVNQYKLNKALNHIVTTKNLITDYIEIASVSDDDIFDELNEPHLTVIGSEITNDSEIIQCNQVAAANLIPSTKENDINNNNHQTHNNNKNNNNNNNNNNNHHQTNPQYIPQYNLQYNSQYHPQYNLQPQYISQYNPQYNPQYNQQYNPQYNKQYNA